MTVDTDLNALLSQLAPPARDALEEIRAARRADLERPPQRTIIPLPDYVGRGIARFPCSLGLSAEVRSYGPGFVRLVHGPTPCWWSYTHDTFRDDDEPISVPVSASTQEVSRLLNERAERRSEELRLRVETAIRAHFALEHPGIELPERTLP
ncbi:hypothetical protein [Streptomyces sp. enrichment culture]|uniref:hypothetical protein n=1 Tax=Streptomyces sp. enrichment culture TaxID=1795815 RepID=UPI003F575E0E